MGRNGPPRDEYGKPMVTPPPPPRKLNRLMSSETGVTPPRESRSSLASWLLLGWLFTTSEGHDEGQV
jgi:hypothetical protein